MVRKRDLHAANLDAWVEAASDRLTTDPGALATQLENVTVRVPVQSLKCGNGGLSGRGVTLPAGEGAAIPVDGNDRRCGLGEVAADDVVVDGGGGCAVGLNRWDG